jgi:Response regulator containing a CheY-like receiver domain and an HTH DNA-binding domain
MVVWLRQILQTQPHARVVLLSGTPGPDEGLSALNEGARGYTHAYGVPALLQEVALVVEHGGLWVGPDLLQRLVGSTSAALAARPAIATTPPPATAAPGANAWALLSARETQVARSVQAGRSNKEVAALMFISERTVKAHLGTIFEKLGVRDRLQLVLRLSAAGPGSSSVTEPSP